MRVLGPRLAFAAVAFAAALAAIVAETQPQRPATRPSFQYTKSGGCHDVWVSAWNQARTEVLSVRLDLDRSKLPTTARPLAVDLSKPGGPARVEVQLYATVAPFAPCSDVGGRGDHQPEIWVARGGTLSLTAVPPHSSDAEYPVTVTIDGAVFEGPRQQRVKARAPIVIKTMAGSMVGG
jgi:hypothetical protein